MMLLQSVALIPDNDSRSSIADERTWRDFHHDCFFLSWISIKECRSNHFFQKDYLFLPSLVRLMLPLLPFQERSGISELKMIALDVSAGTAVRFAKNASVAISAQQWKPHAEEEGNPVLTADRSTAIPSARITEKKYTSNRITLPMCATIAMSLSMESAL